MGALDFVLRVGVDVLNTYLGTTPSSPSGTILATTGNAISGRTDDSNVEWWQHSGYASRPSSPTAGKSACQAIVLRQSDRDVAICSRDVRTNSIYGNLQPGETCVYATGSDGNAQGRSIYKADGSVTHYTTDSNTPAGQAVYFRIHPTKGLTFVAPWGTLTFDQVGFRVQHQSGFSLMAGSIGNLPGPLSALSSYVTVAAGSFTANSSQVYLGPGPLYYVAAGGLADIPLTLPGVPISPAGFGIPCGLFTLGTVHLSGP